jgi:hypothetical protein
LLNHSAADLKSRDCGGGAQLFEHLLCDRACACLINMRPFNPHWYVSSNPIWPYKDGSWPVFYETVQLQPSEIRNQDALKPLTQLVRNLPKPANHVRVLACEMAAPIISTNVVAKASQHSHDVFVKHRHTGYKRQRVNEKPWHDDLTSMAPHRCPTT